MAKRKPAAAEAVVPTIGAAAKALGKHERTLKSWLAKGCPGRPGAYDVAAIAAWHEANVGATLRDDTSEKARWAAEKIKAEARKRKLEVEQLLGRLVDVDLPAREFAQHIVEAKALLEQLPDRFLSFVPGITAAAKKTAKQRMQAAIRDVLAALESSLKRQADADTEM